MGYSIKIIKNWSYILCEISFMLFIQVRPHLILLLAKDIEELLLDF